MFVRWSPDICTMSPPSASLTIAPLQLGTRWRRRYGGNAGMYVEVSMLYTGCLLCRASNYWSWSRIKVRRVLLAVCSGQG